MKRLLFAVLLLTGCGRTVGLVRPDADAPMSTPSGTDLGTGQQPEEEAGPPVPPMAVDWKYAMRHFDVLPFAPHESASPVVAGDLLLAATNRGQTVYALDRATGVTKWVYRAGGRIEATPAIGGGRVFIADAKGRAHGIELSTGKGIWRVDLRGISTSRLAYDKSETAERVIIATGDNHVHALNAKDGGEAWTYRRDPPADLTIYGTSSPVKAKVGAEEAWIVGFSDGSLAAIRASNGTQIWETRLVAGGRFRDVDGSVAIFADRIYVTAFDDNLFCIEASSGKILWSQPPGGNGGTVIAGGKLLHGTDKGEVIARDLADGRELWRWKLPAGVPTTPVVAGEHVFLASSSKSFYAIRLENGSIAWSFDPGYRVSGSWAPPAVSGSRVYFTSNVGTVYAFEPAAPGVQFIGTWDSGARRQ